MCMHQLVYPKKTRDAANDCTLFTLLLQPRVYEATPNMTLPRTVAHGRWVKRHTVFCGTPGFLGVVGTRACNRYKTLFPPLKGPGYEASSYQTLLFPPPSAQMTIQYAIYLQLVSPYSSNHCHHIMISATATQFAQQTFLHSLHRRINITIVREPTYICSLVPRPFEEEEKGMV